MPSSHADLHVLELGPAGDLPSPETYLLTDSLPTPRCAPPTNDSHNDVTPDAQHIQTGAAGVPM